MRALWFFFEFIQIGFCAVGGGLATLPFLFNLADRSDGWLNRELIGNMLAVAQSLPGAIGVNLCAYTGYRYLGILGVSAAVLGLIIPSIIVIIIVARVLHAFKSSAIVKAVFCGLRPAAAGLLAAAALGAIQLSLYNPLFSQWYELVRCKETALFIALFALIYKLKLHPIVYIAAAGLAGILLGL
ncbi:chromate transporter [Breznakiellaceae bacterium SP9]